MGFYNFICGLLRFLSKIFYRVEITGQENIPSSGNVIIVANHKSFLDPVFMMIAVRNRRIIPVAKKELFDVPILKQILKKLEVIPIDRANPGLSTIREILKQIKSGRILGIFPEGTRSSMDKFLPAKPGVGLFAAKTKSQIIPMSIVTKYRVFSKVKIVIGEAVDMTSYYERKIGKEDYAEMAQTMMDAVEVNYEENKDGIL
ncbi:lysophospholipid acyltransferase family protein [Peptostreptococcus russellii]|uniref:lysophospholipid acyltransferase family protein n=1 Tax=Peptostreptococcus russellii TaxID=215200 RepID=UPI0026ED9D2F|nr:lysophospholipid acyltransferase family protein [Peptostreptococcus russellii]